MKINKKKIILKIIKIIDVAYITIIYLILGIIGARMCDKYFGKFDEDNEKKKPLYKSMIEISLYLWFISIIIYIVQNIVPLIPFPLNGIYGYKHLKVQEVTSAGIFAVGFLYFQENYQDKIKYIYTRIDKQ